jgi:hypothetical protein
VFSCCLYVKIISVSFRKEQFLILSDKYYVLFPKSYWDFPFIQNFLILHGSRFAVHIVLVGVIVMLCSNY